MRASWSFVVIRQQPDGPARVPSVKSGLWPAQLYARYPAYEHLSMDHHWPRRWRQWLRDAAALPPNGRRTAMSQHPNRILNALPQNIFAAIEPHLKPVDLAFGDVVAETGQPVGRVHFPHSGVISLVVEMEVGDMIETAMVGRDGAAND